ncbi:ATPase [Streptomyces sp. NPDC096310]|uniref:RapZ C-terminal domain-containing protein n=1 Tax=Streptomyces sp. NPDC096310 TaxID=3366082 RepID=UPI003819D491
MQTDPATETGRRGVVEIVSFGYLHDAPPAAHLTIDLRHHFRDPHITPALRYMTAADQPVRDAVYATPGITNLIAAVAAAIDAYAASPSAGPVTVASGCSGGRHRAPAFASALAALAAANGHQVTVHHRDIELDVVQR